MKMPCERYEEALFGDDAAVLQALAPHADLCASCRAKRLLWKEVHGAAAELKSAWESPELLPRIEAEVQAEAEAPAPRRIFWLPIGIAAAIILYAVAGWLSLATRVPFEPGDGMLQASRERLLSDETLKEVEKREAAFVASIEALERRAGPRLENPPSPLLASFRERLVLLDSAIAECRREISRNEANTNLRRELLAMYQEKKKTLQELVAENGAKKS